MSTKQNTEMTYRTACLPGLGEMQVPAHLTDAEVLAAVTGEDAQATPAKKTKKKP